MRLKNIARQCSKPLLLKLCSTEPQDSAKGCQGFRETKIRNSVRVSLAVLNLYKRFKIPLATLDTNHFDTDSRQSNAASIQKLPILQSSTSAEPAIHTAYVSGETIRLAISLRLAVCLLRVMYMKGKQMLAFNVIFDLLWTGRGSSASSVAF